MPIPSALRGNFGRSATRVVTLFALIIGTAVLNFALGGSATLANAKNKAQYDHIFVIVEENTEYGNAIGNPLMPYFNQLASTNGLATQYFGTIHPSEGNYVAMLGGNSYGINDGPYSTQTISQPSIVDQLEAAGLTWKGYFQSMPTPGYLGTCYPTTGPCLYASKHNGFLNFAHVQFSATEQALLVPDTSLSNDLAKKKTVPNVAFIIPDQCHDKHGLVGTCVDPQLSTQTDAYLQSTVNLLINSKEWQNGTSVIVIVWDEGSRKGEPDLGCCDADATSSPPAGGGQVATVVIQSQNPTALQDSTPFNHYSLVATLQAAFGLGCQVNGTPVGYTCDTANGVKPMSLLFGLNQ